MFIEKSFAKNIMKTFLTCSSGAQVELADQKKGGQSRDTVP